jgi:hypothetical protein
MCPLRQAAALPNPASGANVRYMTRGTLGLPATPPLPSRRASSLPAATALPMRCARGAPQPSPSPPAPPLLVVAFGSIPSTPSIPTSSPRTGSTAAAEATAGGAAAGTSVAAARGGGDARGGGGARPPSSGGGGARPSSSGGGGARPPSSSSRTVASSMCLRAPNEPRAAPLSARGAIGWSGSSARTVNCGRQQQDSSRAAAHILTN